MVRKALILGGMSLSLTSIPCFGATVHGQLPPVELVSFGTDGLAGNHHSGSDGIIPPRTRISADGRYVVFESYASTILCQDNDFSTRDVFVRDRLAGRATLVSIASDGGEANHNSFDPVISADGRYVAFVSQATNLVPEDTNGFNDIFLRDLVAGTTIRLSVSSAGEEANSVSHGPAINGDGRYVAFYSNGSNLVAGDTNIQWDTFVRDVIESTTERISVSTAGVQTLFSGGLNPTITADGRYVAFLSQGSLDPDVLQHNQEIYIRDRTAGTTTLLRPTEAGGLSNTGIRFADISADGRFVAFQSNSDNIVTPDLNGFTHDVFLKDLVTGATTLVSQATDGTQGNQDSWMPSVSADGRYVAFHSWANNLVPGDTNTHPFNDIFVRDTVLGTTTRVNLTPDGGEADGSSTAPSLSADGSLVVFDSTATNLAPNDRINGFPDVFLAGPSYPGGGTSFQFEAAAIAVAESAGLAILTVTRHGPFCTAASVELTVEDGTATAGVDYEAASTTLSFIAGEASNTIEVLILQDGLQEANETLQLILSDPSGGPELGIPSTTTLTILDDDGGTNGPPDAVDDAAVTSENTPVVVPVLSNDSDPDGNPLTITVVTQGSHGAVVDNGNGTLTYTPQPGFNGGDSFTYAITDGFGGADDASVVVTVTPVNDGPTAATDSYGLRENMRLVIPASVGVLVNDSDPEADFLIAVLVNGPAHGTLSLSPNGSFTFTPESGFSGSDSFSYRALDAANAVSDTAIVTLTVKAGEAPVSSVRPVVPAALHRVSSTPRRFMGEPFIGNRRLALIEDGTVPCIEVDTMESARCAFQIDGEFDGTTRLAKSSGDWLEGADGLSYAVVGQPVTRDGTWRSGTFIVGAEPDPDGRLPGIAVSGRDAVEGSASTQLADTCMLEFPESETNVSGMQLRNDVDYYVGTTTLIHPDGADQVGLDVGRGIAWYTGRGAALNDTGGVERSGTGYFETIWGCHYIEFNGVQVPAAKRPSTRSFPLPVVVNIFSRIRWLPVNPYGEIANDSRFDPRILAQPDARFTINNSLDTLWVDASSSVGDILQYQWRLDWTEPAVDAEGPSPLAEFPLVFEVPRASGRITLRVTGRDGQASTLTQRVSFVRPVALFDYALGLNTLWVDASATQGDIREFEWQLDWTDALVDAVGPSPLAEFPLAFQGVPPTSGVITLKVTHRNGQTGTATERVNFRRRPTPPPFPSGNDDPR